MTFFYEPTLLVNFAGISSKVEKLKENEGHPEQTTACNRGSGGQGGEGSVGQWVGVRDLVTSRTPLQSSPVFPAMWISREVAETGGWRLADASRRPQLTMGWPLTVEEAGNYNIHTRIILPWLFMGIWVGLLAFIHIFIYKKSLFKEDVAFIVLSFLFCAICEVTTMAW